MRISKNGLQRKFGKYRRNDKAKATYQLHIASKDVNGGRLFAPRKNPVRLTTTLEISLKKGEFV
jgi:hypothetical protein